MAPPTARPVRKPAPGSEESARFWKDYWRDSPFKMKQREKALQRKEELQVKEELERRETTGEHDALVLARFQKEARIRGLDEQEAAAEALAKLRSGFDKLEGSTLPGARWPYDPEEEEYIDPTLPKGTEGFYDQYLALTDDPVEDRLSRAEWEAKAFEKTGPTGFVPRKEWTGPAETGEQFMYGGIDWETGKPHAPDIGTGAIFTPGLGPGKEFQPEGGRPPSEREILEAEKRQKEFDAYKPPGKLPVTPIRELPKIRGEHDIGVMMAPTGEIVDPENYMSDVVPAYKRPDDVFPPGSPEWGQHDPLLRGRAQQKAFAQLGPDAEAEFDPRYGQQARSEEERRLESKGFPITGSLANAQKGIVESYQTVENSKNKVTTTAAIGLRQKADEVGIDLRGRNGERSLQAQLDIYPPDKFPEFYKYGAGSDHSFEHLSDAGKNRIFHSKHVDEANAIDFELNGLGELSPEFAFLVQNAGAFGFCFKNIKDPKLGGTDGVEWWHWEYDPECAKDQMEEWKNNPESIPGQAQRAKARMEEADPGKAKEYIANKEKIKGVVAKTQEADGDQPFSAVQQRLREMRMLETGSKSGQQVPLTLVANTTGGIQRRTVADPETGQTKEVETKLDIDSFLKHTEAKYQRILNREGKYKAQEWLQAEYDSVNAAHSVSTLASLDIMEKAHAANTVTEQGLEEAKINYAESEEALAKLDSKTQQQFLEFEQEEAYTYATQVEKVMREGNELLDDLAESEVEPYRAFGFYDDDGSFKPSALAMAVGLLALPVNMFVTVMAASKGDKFPLYIYDMLNDAIDRDVKAQVKSLENKREVVNKKFTAAGRLASVHKDKMYIANAMRESLLKRGVQDLKAQAATMDLSRERTAIEQAIPLMDAEYLKQKRATYRGLLNQLKGRGDFATGMIKSMDSREDAVAGQVIQLLGKKASTTKGKGTTDDGLYNRLKAFEPELLRYEKLWNRYGKDIYGAWKRIAVEGFVLDAETWNLLSSSLKPKALQALQEMENIRQVNAALLHGISGDKGPVAVQEQHFSKGRLPMKTDYKLGKKLIKKFIALHKMMSSQAWHNMSPQDRDSLGATMRTRWGATEDSAGDPEGMTKAAEAFLKSSGEKTNRPSGAALSEEELKKREVR